MDEEEVFIPEENLITLAHLCDAGFLYTKEGDRSEEGTPYINDRFTRQEIASLSGVSRETVSRSLGAFIQAGILRIDNNRIYILNENRLKKEGRVQ